MKAKFLRRRKWLIPLVITLCGVALLNLAYRGALSLSSRQEISYNLGLNEYTNTQEMEKALAYFDASIAEYQAAQDLQQTGSWSERWLYPKPSKEILALAHFQKGKILLQMQKAEEAIKSWKESLAVNPGGDFPDDMDVETMKCLAREAKVVQYDLDMMFKKNPSQAKKEGGQGEGKPGKGKGKPGDKGKGDKPGKERQPSQQPGSQPGNGDSNKI